MRTFGFPNLFLVRNKGENVSGGERGIKSSEKDFSLVLRKEISEYEIHKNVYKKGQILKNPFKVNIPGLVVEKGIFFKSLAQKVIKNKLHLKEGKLIKHFKEVKLNKSLKAKRWRIKEFSPYSLLTVYHIGKLINPATKEEIISQNLNNIQNKKALLHYKKENSFIGTKLIPLKGDEKKNYSSLSFGFINLQSQKKELILNQLQDGFRQKKVFRLAGVKYNKLKRVFSLKIPLDEQTVLKITSFKNNFYAQITTGAERVNLLLQNLQTLTQQIASLGFSSTVIKVQATNGGGSNSNFNGRGQSNGGNNKDKNVSNNRWKVENHNRSFTSFSFYL